MIKSLQDYKFVILSVENYNVLGIIRTLGENGIRPDAIIRRADYTLASKSKYIRKLYMVDSFEEGYRVLLENYGHEDKPVFVINGDDWVTNLLDLHYDELKGRFIFNNAREAGKVTKFMGKYEILKLAEKHGLNVPKTCVVKKGEIPDDIEYPVLTKATTPTMPEWKKESFVCRDESELCEAFSQIKSDTILIQQYIRKKNELCLDGFTIDRGRKVYITIASTYNYILENNYSSHMTVKSFNNPEIEAKIGAMFAEIGFEGIFSLEFLITENDELYFLEINFRNSTWSYASTKADMPLPVLWSAGMIDSKLVENCIKPIAPEGFIAIVEPADYNVRVKEHEIGFFTWLKEIMSCKCRFYLNRKDMMPVYYKVWNKIVKIILCRKDKNNARKIIRL